MQAEELMHNDLFMYGGNLCRFVIRSTDAIVQRLCDKTTYLPCAVREAEPIPLTEEIFKANGFEKNPYYEEWVKPLNNQYKLRVSNKHISVVRGGTYPFNFVGNPTKYVHELQHALRLCRLNELADNFKIK